MSAGIGFELDNLDPDEVETSVRSGGVIPAGQWHAELVAATDGTSKSKGTLGHTLTFRIYGGAFDGKEVKDTIYVSDKPATQIRRANWATKLGLVVKTTENGKSKYTLAPGKASFDFAHCIGAKVVLETVIDTYEKRDGSEGQSTKFSWNGIKTEAEGKDVPAGGLLTPQKEKKAAKKEDEPIEI